MATGMIVFILHKTLIIAFHDGQGWGQVGRSTENGETKIGKWAWGTPPVFSLTVFFAAFLPTKRLGKCKVSQNKSLVHSWPINPLNEDLIQSARELKAL